MGVVAGLAAAAVAVAAVVLAVRRAFSGQVEPAIVRYPTRFGSARVYSVVYKNGETVRVLEIDGAYQSATYTDERYCELVFDYYRGYDLMFAGGRAPRRVLMLGGGGYAWPKHLVATRPDVRLDVVEADPDITLIAQRWFYLDRLVEEFGTEESGQLRIFHEDARTFLEAGGQSYDAIANDCFAGRRPAMTLATVEAARAVQARLAPGGVYLTNAISSREGERAWFLQALLATLRSVFAHVAVVPCSDAASDVQENNMVVASDAPLALPGAVDVAVPPDVHPLTDATAPDFRIRFAN